MRRADVVRKLVGDGREARGLGIATQVEHVVAGHAEVAAGNRRDFGRQAVADHRRSAGDVQLVVAERVVEDAGDVAQHGAAVELRRGDESVVDQDARAVELAGADHDAPTRGLQNTRLQQCCARYQSQFAETIGGAAAHRAGQHHPHALQALVEVHAVERGLQRVAGGRLDVAYRRCDGRRRQEAGVDDPRRGQRIAAALHREQAAADGGVDLRGRQVGGAATGPELLHLAGHEHGLAHQGLGAGAAAEHVDGVGREVVAVAAVLEPEAVAVDARHDAGDVGDVAACHRRAVRGALNRADRLCQHGA